MIRVRLLAHTPDPERVVARAGRLCYYKLSIAELDDEMTDTACRELLGRLTESGHLSTFEHASFTFGIEGVSRACTHQLVRHRIASYSQQSQRYVDLSGVQEFVVPSVIAERGEARELFEEALDRARDAYERLIALGIPKEDARYVLPNAAETRIIVTMNARELLHFFTLRGCVRAQWEIRALALAMLKEARAVAPALFGQAGPECVRTRCTEGRMSCGRAAEIKAEIALL